MPVRVTCAACGRVVKVRESTRGKAIKCPDCGERIAVPRASGRRGASTRRSSGSRSPVADWEELDDGYDDSYDDRYEDDDGYEDRPDERQLRMALTRS